MSRKGRDALLIESIFGPVVRTTDLRYTPRATIEALFDSDPPPDGCVLDPCAGDGAILRVAKARGYEVAAVEIREEERDALDQLDENAVIGDWLRMDRTPWTGWSVVTNPPFSLAREFAASCLALQPEYMAFLLRCNVIGSRPWRAFWRQHPPTRVRPVERPAFPKPGESVAEGTDASEYAWFIWVTGEPLINLKPI